MVMPNLSLDPDASPAALARGPLGAGELGSLGIIYIRHASGLDTVFVAFRLAFSTVNDALGARPDWQIAAAAPATIRDWSRAAALCGQADPAIGAELACRCAFHTQGRGIQERGNSH